MTGLALSFDLTDEVSGTLQVFISGLRDRAGLHEAISTREVALVRGHLTRIAQERHDTAERLGAAPSGHWAQAAEKTFGESTSEAAIVAINQPGIGRAAHDVTLTAPTSGGKQWFTIPLIAEAYNQRAAGVDGLFFVQPAAQGDYALLGKREGKGKEAVVTWWYLLTKEIFQKQDRSLLPSDEEFLLTAHEGVRDYLGYLLATGGAA